MDEKEFPAPGVAVQVKIYGSDEWQDGITLDRPRKMWIQLKDRIADENSIVDWRLATEGRVL